MQKVEGFIEVTPDAKKRLLEAISKFGKNYQYVRIEVESGGCACGCGAGFSYAMSLEENPTEEDLVQDLGEIKLVSSKMSAELLKGSVIDYYEGLEASGFVVNNPNIQGSGCGCGGH
ncbi:hypothetical protein B9Q11_00990 [Candidatus Marsarchaeota G2 archaeon ECH_B_SAG-F08]|jgi:iron-sulfur cluster assembly accessory protein|uniref:Core domain-containing protein n=6 Tax=Candidatus Marsarchaeota TaxID=1978152 RepID=A0A2R6BYQ7_9ARCH|nr:MAG: hypothetical protein B9Q01_07330 [Candidatus Marsarchaeota G1 archaeon OSP_D]PSN85912.1 MAG: hypothetical protein B9Q02_04340 [Candidatus Marsarchaeota G1 archaeon BE_D]PSN88609.1 MAG: hypothetical protein B9Q00_04840 [Candidatus Marsarchaeota G1 archaeon OSP_C]PSN99287.1 MAG: hypothetical protein B9Q11_00990 [Candidatus Marsarchaeota G2 archaeon ECH_B_SAG-F08]PSO02914.1 MAG: hypothetical protein B9Q10_00910 [Candidatus Marsarchaeota G2 archaeon ECH_B_SAG-E12]PSO03763.1 MAG: hypothetic